MRGPPPSRSLLYIECSSELDVPIPVDVSFLTPGIMKVQGDVFPLCELNPNMTAT